ncbi:hypothetical protein HS048_01095 [Planomonospora sp. ID91781]|uniref:hypothetical protein n=1 Tax=Planomonospora sp. ID91781 TaxID=2738135 RepID=UPI0018C43B40|nr:hypothetical protein [Planomonospora sp. ID91781]MBG0819360.1 hypothetical protein [Planomonospora sp. ID91781]
MTRRSRMLWAAALLWAAVPAAYLGWLEMQALLTPPTPPVPPEEYDGNIYGMVQLFSGGRLLKILILIRYVQFTGILGVAPYVLLGLGMCLLGARLGRPRTGRVAAGLLAAVLVPMYSLHLVLFLVEGSAESMDKGPQWPVFSAVGGDLYQLAAVALMVLALRSDRPRRGEALHPAKTS